MGDITITIKGGDSSSENRIRQGNPCRYRRHAPLGSYFWRGKTRGNPRLPFPYPSRNLVQQV